MVRIPEPKPKKAEEAKGAEEAGKTEEDKGAEEAEKIAKGTTMDVATLGAPSPEGSRGSVTVEAENPDWKELKKRFWEDYAKKELGDHRGDNIAATHDINNDEDTYTCSLTKKEADGTEKPLGLIYYTSEFNAQVSKDADLAMYKGLVTDAATNNLSITFGDSLNDKQKALLLAAVLIHQNEENKQVKMIKEPQIDLNAPYFKELPQEAQDVLKKQAEIKNTKEKIAPQQPRATLNSTRLLMPHNKESGR